jgi:hypothetical protein
MTRPRILLLLSVFVAAGTTIDGIQFIEPLPSNDRRDAHTDTQTDGRDLGRYVIKMGSGAMRYVRSVTKIGSGIRKWMGEGDSDIQTA